MAWTGKTAGLALLLVVLGCGCDAVKLSETALDKENLAPWQGAGLQSGLTVGWLYGHPAAEYPAEQKRVAAALLGEAGRGADEERMISPEMDQQGFFKRKKKRKSVPELCPYRCNKRGKCLPPRGNKGKPQPGASGLPMVAYKCECKKGWTGKYCEKRVDVLLLWLMTRGKSDRPPCCNICSKQVFFPKC